MRSCNAFNRIPKISISMWVFANGNWRMLNLLEPNWLREKGIQHSTNLSNKQIEIVTLSHHTYLTFSNQMIINCYSSTLRIPFPFTFDSFSLKCFQLSLYLSPSLTHTYKYFQANRFVRSLFSCLGFEFSFSSFTFSMLLCVCVCVHSGKWYMFIAPFNGRMYP